MDVATNLPKIDANSPLCTHERAAFAMTSRLISCLVTEQIIPAFYVPLYDAQEARGLAVVFSSLAAPLDNIRNTIFSPVDIFAILLLQHEPVFKDSINRGTERWIGLLDPLDMLPFVYQIVKLERKTEDHSGREKLILSSLPFVCNSIEVCPVQDPILLWQKFSDRHPMEEKICENIENELRSCFHWQIRAYENPPKCPTLQSPSIEWEQSLVTGHPTHPMYRSRSMDQVSLDYDWYHPRVCFVRVPRTEVQLLGQFESISKRLVTWAAQKSKCSVDVEDSTCVYIPVHELQIQNIKSKFRNVEFLDPEVSLPAQAQASLRTVEIADFPELTLKLAVGVRISSALRTISHYSADFGPRFSRDVVPKLAVNHDILHIELESSGAFPLSPNPEVASHFTAIVREKYNVPLGEAVIVVAALLDAGHANLPDGVSVVERVFELDSKVKKEAFLDRFIQLACQSLIPPLIKNGVSFDAHAQNVQARFDVNTKELLGFVVRDLAGMRIHQPTLRKSTGVDFQFLDGHVVDTKVLEEILPKFYHTFVNNFIQRLIRILGMHSNGRGWELLRKHMGDVIPTSHMAWKLWMDPAIQTVESKCLMRMRIRDVYRGAVSRSLPNLIQHRPSNIESRK